jgi:rhamnulokinase
MATNTALAVDLGAESGRVMAAHFDGATLHLEALHRFPNRPVTARGTLHWDILRLWDDIQIGIGKGKAHQPASLGVDTWGVDFALLDAQGALLGNPVHYRDHRTDGVMERVTAQLSRATIFEQTGIQFLPFNTLYQMASMVATGDIRLKTAETFLTIPDLLNYWLTGTKVCEFSNATTTQLYNPRTAQWATPLMDALEIPSRLFPDIVPPGTRLGAWEGISVIAPATHDTGSAVAAIPAQTPHFAYISSGTWSLVGLEITQPLINEASLAANITNEGGVNDTFRLLKNVMGLWIVQQCRATWAAEGTHYDYSELMAQADAAPALQTLIPIDDPRLLPPGDHPAIIRTLCAEQGEPIPETHGAMVRAVLESLALAYRGVLERLETLANHPIEVIHIVGGGAQNRLLCQMTANATGKRVLAGPVEATVLGNALVQLIALGEIADLAQARQIVAQMSDVHDYTPQATDVWEDAYRRWQTMTIA